MGGKELTSRIKKGKRSVNSIMNIMDIAVIVRNLDMKAILPWTLFDQIGIMEKSCGQGMFDSLLLGTAVSDILERFWEMGVPQLVLGIAILLILLKVANYVIEKIRPKPAQKEHPAHEMLLKFSEMHSKGVLSDEEFRTIKTNLASQLQDELKDNGKEG
jgi:hypothetical protein